MNTTLQVTVGNLSAVIRKHVEKSETEDGPQGPKIKRTFLDLVTDIGHQLKTTHGANYDQDEWLKLCGITVEYRKEAAAVAA